MPFVLRLLSSTAPLDILNHFLVDTPYIFRCNFL